MDTLRCPTCLTLLVDAEVRRCPACRTKLRTRRGHPIVLGAESRLSARPTAFDDALKARADTAFAPAPLPDAEPQAELVAELVLEPDPEPEDEIVLEPDREPVPERLSPVDSSPLGQSLNEILGELQRKARADLDITER